MGELWAHSANERKVRHRLEDHLRGTAERARLFAQPFGAGDLAWYLGLVHDIGKASCAWQERLVLVEGTTKKVEIDHKTAGAWLADQAARPFGLCVHGHHGGMPKAGDLRNELEGAGPALISEWEQSVAAVAALIPQVCLPPGTKLIPQWYIPAYMADKTAPDMLARMVFSALVDADFLDTEAHFRDAGRVDTLPAAGELAARYAARRPQVLAERPTGSAEVNAWREDIYAMALAAAEGPRGIYRFPAQTGSGKTISAGAFALRHAQVHGLRRVVVAVPYISITEQNADVYRRLLDNPDQAVVLEHHSSAGLDASSPATNWSRLAAENWDAPFIVTTTVQLFQSLFDHRPAAMRKLHRLAGSVIVLDEVQALPDRLLLPVLSGLCLLVEHFGATVLLASATQPSFWKLSPFKTHPPRNVVPDHRPLPGRFRRVKYQWRIEPRPTLASIAAEAAGERQVLIIVNTTGDSAALHRAVAAGREGDCLHLSTRMTGQHRRNVLARIRHLLDAGEPVAVVSTQLIEAGVDIDFPVVYRAWAPAESLQQAAGRANRNGRLSTGQVIVFDPSDGHQPADSSYLAALNATAAYFGPGLADPDDRVQLDAYYAHRYARQGLNETGKGAKIQKLRENLDFPQVANDFQLIEQHTIPVAVAYPPGDESAKADLERITRALRATGPASSGRSRKLMRELQPYLATIPKWLGRRAQDAGYAKPLIGDVLEWVDNAYDPLRGIDLADLAGQGPGQAGPW